MNKKTFTQFFLLSVIFLLCFYIFKIYFFNKKQKNSSIKNSDKIKPNTEITSDIMYKIKYTSEEALGNIYVVEAEQGEFKGDNQEKILMKDVLAKIKIKDSSPIEITANYSLYNKINYDTKFYENVIITYENNIIASDKFDLFFEKKIAIISDNIIYKNLNTEMIADKIEIDLITKNSKILMNDTKKKN